MAHHSLTGNSSSNDVSYGGMPQWLAALLSIVATGVPHFGIIGQTIAGMTKTNETTGTSVAGDIWNDITGKTNTTEVNSATAALQEDAQAFNAEEAEKQRAWEAQQAEIARKWQEDMSNTAIQRQQADLKAAGLNPWLAANGSGASTGSVGIASGDSASSAQGQAINATKSGAEVLAAVGITAASIIKILKMLK